MAQDQELEKYFASKEWQEILEIAKTKARKRKSDCEKWGFDEVVDIEVGNLVNKYVSGRQSEIKHIPVLMQEFSKELTKDSSKFEAWKEEKQLAAVVSMVNSCKA